MRDRTGRVGGVDGGHLPVAGDVEGVAVEVHIARLSAEGEQEDGSADPRERAANEERRAVVGEDEVVARVDGADRPGDGCPAFHGD